MYIILRLENEENMLEFQILQYQNDVENSRKKLLSVLNQISENKEKSYNII